MAGIFGRMFDLNRDGHVDTLEKSIGLATFVMILDEEERVRLHILNHKNKLKEDKN